MLAKCHNIRNLGEYEGDLRIDDRIVQDMITACQHVAQRLSSLTLPD